MKVLLCNYEYPPMGGGAGNATANIARALTLLDVEPTVLTSRNENQPTTSVEDGVKIHRVFSWRKGIHDCGTRGAYTYLLSASWRLISTLGRQDFDVVHHFFSLPTGVLSLLPGRARRVPYVVSLRGSDVPGYDPFNHSLERIHRWVRPINRTIWRRAGRVVALSEGLRETALKTDPDVRIDVVGNGIETDAFAPQVQRERTTKVRFLVVSRLIERKGIQHIIEAVSRLRGEFPLEVLVAGDGSYRGALEHAVERAGVKDVFRFLGYQPRTELPALYREADVFLLPSLAESFGMVFVEAMASGLPVIGGRTGGVPGIVKKENGILVTPGSVEEIVAAMRELASDSGLRQDMGQNNRRRAVEKYSWHSVATQYRDIYGEIASGS